MVFLCFVMLVLFCIGKMIGKLFIVLVKIFCFFKLFEIGRIGSDIVIGCERFNKEMGLLSIDLMGYFEDDILINDFFEFDVVMLV